MRIVPANQRRRLVAPLAALIAWLAGCQAPTAPAQPTVAEAPADDIDELWDDALRAVRHFGFDLDLQDRVHRVITTHPLTAAQPWEIWRRDVADPYSALESAMHNVQRRVTVRFTPLPERRWKADVRVAVLRLVVPERQATTASAALQIFSSRSPTIGGEVLSAAIKADRSFEIRRDPVLERRILERIVPSSMRELASSAR